MLKQVLLILSFVMIVLNPEARAQDYLVDYVAEFYREMPSDTGSGSRIYHTLQVTSPVGSRLLVLTGDDLGYRNWLRQYLSGHDRLLVAVPGDRDALFRRSKLFEIDVTAVHPFRADRWESTGSIKITPPYTGERQVLIADPDPVRQQLLSLVVKDLGYPVTVTGSGEDALRKVKHQPDRYRLLITDVVLPGLDGIRLVREILSIDPEFPVVLGTGYGTGVFGPVADAFSGSASVVVKPVLLQELTQTLVSLLKDKA